MKPVFLIPVLLSSQFLWATSHLPVTTDLDLQFLYSERKFIESESLRVVITIEALEERLLEIPLPDEPEELFLHLESLYRYYAELDTYQRELNDQWNQLMGIETGASAAFTAEQFKPIPFISKKYLEGLPEGTIPFPTSPSIPIK